MQLMRKLSDETKKLISDAINSGSDLNSDNAGKKKEEKKGNRTKSVAKAAAVEVHSRNPLANIELMTNQLNSGAMTDAAVVYAWGYDDLATL